MHKTTNYVFATWLMFRTTVFFGALEWLMFLSSGGTSISTAVCVSVFPVPNAGDQYVWSGILYLAVGLAVRSLKTLSQAIQELCNATLRFLLWLSSATLMIF